ncbi:hypothetical protein EWM64_g6756, partial [Hericium alpestre]
MESLNLNTLATSLPTANLANAEKDLLNDFKAAALSITTLYRSSRTTSKKAYNAGYAAACQDMLQMIQQGVSDSESEGGSGMPTIGRVMDWVEARIEAIRAREEEEEEDEEREKAGHVKIPQPAPAPGLNRAKTVPVQNKDNNTASTSTKHSQPPQSSPPSPSPTIAQRPLLPRTAKSRASTSATPTTTFKQPIINPAGAFSFNVHAPVSTALYTSPSSDTTASPIPVHTSPTPSSSALPAVAAGAKRRHAMMMMLDSTPSA